MKKLPPLYSQEDNPDPMVVCKFFTPDEQAGRGMPPKGHRLMSIGYDDTDKEKVDYIFFGLVSGAEVEQGMIVARDVPHEDARPGSCRPCPGGYTTGASPRPNASALGEAAGIKGDDAIGFPQLRDHLPNQHTTNG